ncbi:MAG: hypothetical protein MRQ09_01300 [Candidatus Midichloria sp.]|nr:hypothetical protein [Candidatus Midichloria sp.]
MSLYLLNIGEAQVTKSIGSKYQTEITGENYLSVCIKAIEEVINSLEISIDNCKRITEVQSNDKLEASEELIKYKTDFAKAVMRAKELMEAFIYECQSIRGEKEIVDYIEFLRNRFDVLLAKINFFYLLQNVQHGEAALELSKLLLNLFKNCLKNNSNADLTKITNRNSYDKFLKSDQETKDFDVEDKIK